MLLVAMLFLPVMIFVVMNRLLGKQLLSEGKKEEIITFAVLCFAIYIALLILTAQFQSK